MIRKTAILVFLLSCFVSCNGDLYSKFFLSRILYNANGATGGSVPDDNNEYNKGESAVVLGNAGSMTRPGYSFAGWALTPDGYVRYVDGDVYTVGQSDVTLYAVWICNLTTVSTYAGVGQQSGNVDPGGTKDTLSIRLDTPVGIALDSSENLYIADWNNFRIREVVRSTYLISNDIGVCLFPGFNGDGSSDRSTWRLSNPQSIYINSSGDVIFSDSGNNRLRKVDHATGVLSTIAGNGTIGFGGENISATDVSVELYHPCDIAEYNGEIYFADTGNHRIRKISSQGIISTVAGDGSTGNTGDGGPATSASFVQPEWIVLDSEGNLYVSDSDSNVNVIRKIDHTTGRINTIAGNAGAGAFGGDGGPADGSTVRFDCPAGLAVDKADNLYIADRFNNVIRKINHRTNIITTVVGNHTAGYTNPSAALSAPLNGPCGIKFNSRGHLYFSEASNHVIRKVE